MNVRTKWYRVELTVHQSILVQAIDSGDDDSNKENARWTAYEESDLITLMTDDWEAEVYEVKDEDLADEKNLVDKVVTL